MRILWSSLFLLVPIAGLAAFIVAGLGHSWLPENVSTTGEDIDLLFYLILGITGFFFVLTEVLLVFAMFHGRGGENGKGHFIHGSHKLEIAWTFVTTGILLFIAVYQIPTWRKAKFTHVFPKKQPDALVTASQFLWQVRYPIWDEATNAPKELNSRNPNLQESFELTNELHVPVNEPVLIHLTTRDVIHSFWIPNMRVKQDALPGHMIPVWFDATKPGQYEWLCAELCGWGHARMRARVIVHEKAGPKSYPEWLKARTKELQEGPVAQVGGK